MQLGGDPVALFVLEISHLLKFDIGSLVKHKLCQQLPIIPFEQPEATQFPIEERNRSGAARIGAPFLHREGDFFHHRCKPQKAVKSTTGSSGRLLPR